MFTGGVKPVGKIGLPVILSPIAKAKAKAAEDKAKAKAKVLKEFGLDNLQDAANKLASINTPKTDGKRNPTPEEKQFADHLKGNPNMKIMLNGHIVTPIQLFIESGSYQVLANEVLAGATEVASTNNISNIDAFNYMNSVAIYEEGANPIVESRHIKQEYTIKLTDLSSGREILVAALEPMSEIDGEHIKSMGFMSMKMENADPESGFPIGKFVLFVPPNEGALLMLRAVKDPLSVSFANIQNQAITGE